MLCLATRASSVLKFCNSNSRTSRGIKYAPGAQWPPFYNRLAIRTRLGEKFKKILTRPVAPQHASLASNITIFRFFPRSSCRRKCAAQAPDIPLPMMTTSACVGRAAVVRWPRRILEGSLCQNDFVELAVGRLAWPDGAVPPVMLV
jgi:hypothetical protein